MGIPGTTAVFLTSLTGIPLAYLLNILHTMNDPLAVFGAGTAAIIIVALIPYVHARNKPQRPDVFYYVLPVLTFASVIDIIIGLENDGIIADFMTFYLNEGEPYLKTAHGTMICYWDGVAHFAMYLMILGAMAWNQSYQEVGLYWAGSFGHSMIVFIPGSVVGKFGVKWSIMLNIPYIIIPFWAGFRFLKNKSTQPSRSQPRPLTPVSSIWRRPLDVIFVLYFLLSSVVAVFRACAVLGCSAELTEQYVKHYEPYLLDPTTYPKIQMLVYVFYFVPYYIGAIYGLLFQSDADWMSDWSLIHAGAAAQGQFSHIGSSLHSRTPYVMRVPQDSHVRFVFWILNLGLLVVPQLFAFRCVSSVEESESEEITEPTVNSTKHKIQ